MFNFFNSSSHITSHTIEQDPSTSLRMTQRANLCVATEQKAPLKLSKPLATPSFHTPAKPCSALHPREPCPRAVILSGERLRDYPRRISLLPLLARLYPPATPHPRAFNSDGPSPPAVISTGRNYVLFFYFSFC